MAVFGKGKRSKATTETKTDEVSATAETPTTMSEEAAVEAKAGVAAAVDNIDKDAKHNQELEAKYPHLVPGSIRLVPRGEQVDGIASKGKVGTIACVDCGEHRTVNVQDVFQVQRCRACTATALKAKQQARRAARKATKEKSPDATENGSAA